MQKLEGVNEQRVNSSGKASPFYNQGTTSRRYNYYLLEAFFLPLGLFLLA